jgi:hypothetical protein
VQIKSRRDPGKRHASGPVFILTLCPKTGVDPIRDLPGTLKTLLRRHGLRCVALRESGIWRPPKPKPRYELRRRCGRARGGAIRRS